MLLTVLFWFLGIWIAGMFLYLFFTCWFPPTKRWFRGEDGRGSPGEMLIFVWPAALPCLLYGAVHEKFFWRHSDANYNSCYRTSWFFRMLKYPGSDKPWKLPSEMGDDRK